MFGHYGRVSRHCGTTSTALFVCEMFCYTNTRWFDIHPSSDHSSYLLVRKAILVDVIDCCRLILAEFTAKIQSATINDIRMASRYGK